jgi:uncharacterized repeat protein (TIGR03803 family)
MLRELDFIESDWAALLWALGSTRAIFKQSVPRGLRALFGKCSNQEEGPMLKLIRRNAAGTLSGVMIAVGVLVGAFGLVRLLFVLFPEPDLKRVQWAELLAVIVVPETIFIVSALALWRKRRSMAVGIVMSAVTLGPDGGTPESSLLLDAAGKLFGTTNVGGTGAGTIFQVTPAGKETLLHSFGSGDGAAGPNAALVQDAAGNFYGLSNGIVFKLDSTGNESVLFTFTGNDSLASGELVEDAAGNLYGVTTFGANGMGTVFKLTTPPDFAVPAFTLTPASVAPSSPASATLDLITVSGFNDTVTLACSVSPSPAKAPQCSVPASATPGTQVTVTPRPVIAPPRPTAKYEPPVVVLNRRMLVASSARRNSGKMARCLGSLTMLRTWRPKSSANSWP